MRLFKHPPLRLCRCSTLTLIYHQLISSAEVCICVLIHQPVDAKLPSGNGQNEESMVSERVIQSHLRLRLRSRPLRVVKFSCNAMSEG